MKEKVYLQITSGRGPTECCRVVALVLERIVRQAQASGLKVEMIEREVGPVNRTLLSATIALQGTASGELADEWEGTVQWIAQSPYRIYHKRKNWFVGVHSFVLSESQEATERDFRYETLRGFRSGRAACQQDRVRGPCRSHPVRDECGSFRPTFTMAEQEAGNGTPVGETFVMDDGTGDDSGAGKLE